MENRLVRKEERRVRISKKLKAIEDLYHLAFETKDRDKIISYKKEFKLQPDVKDLKKQANQLQNTINEIVDNTKKASEVFALVERLNQVHIQLTSVIEEEFKTVRTRNSRLSV